MKSLDQEIHAVQVSPIFANMEQVNQSFNLNTKLLLTCTAGTLMSIGHSDGEICKTEAEYLGRYLAHLHNMDIEISEKIIDLNLFVVRNCKKYKTYLKAYVEYLNKVLSEKNKEKFVETAFVIARSDMDISDEEENMIKDINFSLGLHQTVYDQAKLNASTIIESRKEQRNEELVILGGTNIWNI